MRLEPFCKFTMRYTQASWHRPYGRASGQAEEGLGFGRGEGEVSGEIEGALGSATIRGAARTGVWKPNLRGYISTSEAREILVAIHGQSVQEDAPGYRRRAILARVELTTQDAEYQWLNTCFLVGEGRDR